MYSADWVPRLGTVAYPGLCAVGRLHKRPGPTSAWHDREEEPALLVRGSKVTIDFTDVGLDTPIVRERFLLEKVGTNGSNAGCSGNRGDFGIGRSALQLVGVGVAAGLVHLGSVMKLAFAAAVAIGLIRAAKWVSPGLGPA